MPMFLKPVQSSLVARDEKTNNIFRFPLIEKFVVHLVDMSSTGSASLPPLEDRFSMVLSRLERIETSLRGLEDIKKYLRDIEDNTHPEEDGKSVFREDMTEKVRFAVF